MRLVHHTISLEHGSILKEVLGFGKHLHFKFIMLKTGIPVVSTTQWLKKTKQRKMSRKLAVDCYSEALQKIKVSIVYGTLLAF